jgi:hypothetical protein
MIRIAAIIHGHHECRSLKQTVPILLELVALEIKSLRSGKMTMKHPHTNWPLVVHEPVPARQTNLTTITTEFA